MIRWIPLILMAGWWIFALQFQWRTQPEYKFGWLNLVLTSVLIFKTKDLVSAVEERKLVNLRWPVLLLLVGTPFVIAAELYRNGVAASPVYAFVLSIGTLLLICSWSLLNFDLLNIKKFIFPTIFFLLAVPIPKVLWNPIVLGLQSLIVQLNIESLLLLGISASQSGNIIILGVETVGVDEACSGVRSLQSTVMVTMFVSYFVFNRQSQRLVLIISGVGLAILGNFLRSITLCLAANSGGSDLLNKIHDIAGWISFISMMGGIAFVVYLMQMFQIRSNIDAKLQEKI
jgi:exosortase